MSNIFSTSKQKVKGKDDKYKKPEQPADINDHTTIATSQGGTLEKDKEVATCSKSKPSSTGSSDTTAKTENKKPTDSKKPKKQKCKADPDSSDSSDTDSSIDLSGFHFDDTIITETNMSNIFSTSKKKVKGKDDKYKKPEQPADINDHTTIATSQGGTLEKDKEVATCSKSKPSSTGSSDTTARTENKKPTDSKKPKKQKCKADPNSSDSSDTDSSIDLSGFHFDDTIITETNMSNIFSTSKQKVKGKDDKYKKPEQPADINDHTTIATSQGGTLEKDKEVATCSKSKPSSTGSSDTTAKTENKKPTDSKKPKKQKCKADPDSSDSSDTDSSIDLSASDSTGHKKNTRKVHTNKHGETAIKSKQVNIEGPYTKVKRVKKMVVNIIDNSIHYSSQPKQNIPQISGVKTSYNEPYNDKTKGTFFGKPRVGAAHGNIHEGSHSRIEGIDISELKVRSEKSVCRIQYSRRNETCYVSGFRIGPPEMGLIITTRYVLDDILIHSESSIIDAQNGNYLAKGDVWCVFNHTTDYYQVEDKDKFYFKPVIHFNDPETDTTILELKPNEHGTPMPPSFTQFRMPEHTKPFYLIGHPAGGKKMSCWSTNIVDMVDPNTSNSISNLRSWCAYRNLACEGSRENSLDNPARLLFHVDDNFKKGAAGCPGLVINPPCVSVVTVLLRGYPDFFYNEYMYLQQKDELPKEYIVDQGANMQCVFANLYKQNQTLHNKLL